ncbi:MAG: non-lysosomal glucosylceramidase, partial [Acidobacteria bacterium]|nr:non-lysosomal glucosylceramidase [Acidobacteriota bacterium]
GRRGFLKAITVAAGMASQVPPADAQPQSAGTSPTGAARSAVRASMQYPRAFTGRQLAAIAFPLGGVAAGSISLGGRGQLRDWEIFNRPDKHRSPEYAFAAIWVQSGKARPLVRVLEASLMPPYQGTHGLAPANAPGLLRLDSATFIGEYPMAKVAFRDSQLPVEVTLEGFSPFVPLDADESGLPLAVLRYRVSNPGSEKAAVSIAFAIDNPVGTERYIPTRLATGEKRVNEYRQGANLEGLLMRNPALAATDPMAGTFALSLLNVGKGKVSHLRGWKLAKWWTSPLLYWDDFSRDGELGPEAPEQRPVGSLCLKREIEPGTEADYTFLLSWHFPNRTPEHCGWRAPKGDEGALIGNYYCTRFADAWQAAEYAAARLETLEARTRKFMEVMREATLPAAVKDAAMSNLSTLATQTCFRAASGEFYGFEGCDAQRGCCFGNCTHVWNYETATQYLFPSLARSLRKIAFGFAQDEDGSMRHRQLLPDGKERYGYAAADGQMGQIIKAYLDWRLSGDTDWLRELWPRIKKGVAFAWVPGGWDADRDGVMEGVQHNTYDVEFYGPNPQCGIYYLGALRAAEEMARAVGDSPAAKDFRDLFTRGSQWIDENLFNGEYYIQKVRSIPAEKIAKATISEMGSDRTENPDFQLGDGCLADQLIGQYLASLAGLGDLLQPARIRKTMESIYRYNYKRNLYQHESVQRVYALNDEAGLVVCDYAKGERPQVPFPYFAEVWTGLEYLAAVLMLYVGMVREGVECIESARRRYDGERRNPWDEAECGHHYARAMAAWSAIPALSGFQYHGVEKKVEAAPRLRRANFVSFWSTATSWGKFSHAARAGRLRFSLQVVEGALPCRMVVLHRATAGKPVAQLDGRSLGYDLHQEGSRASFTFSEEVPLKAGQELVLIL